MIRTTFVPTDTDCHISIPQNYVGKQVEVLLYSIEEIESQKAKSNGLANLRGKLNLSKEQYNNFQEYAQSSRNEWNKDI